MANEYSRFLWNGRVIQVFCINVEFLKTAENKAKQNGITQKLESDFLKVV